MIKKIALSSNSGPMMESESQIKYTSKLWVSKNSPSTVCYPQIRILHIPCKKIRIYLGLKRKKITIKRTKKLKDW